MDIEMTDEDFLMHYGTPRRSGRYPWGSGEGAIAANSRDFLGMIDDLRKQGVSEEDIMKSFDMNTSEYRAAKSIATSQKRADDIAMAETFRAKGMSNVKIGERMGIPESSVRSLLAPGAKDRANILKNTTDMLKQQVEEKEYVDVGKGSELSIHGGISRERLKTALVALEQEGYKRHYVKVLQLGTGKYTTVTVLTKPGVPYSQVFKNQDKIQQINSFSQDGGRSILGIHEPLSFSSKRLGINYKEDGGDQADGVIYVRPGVKDVSIGQNRYAQVRVLVDGTHFVKGMAIYNDQMPPGKDLVFNTNKSNTGNKLNALKSIKDDPENPFQSIVRQIVEKDEHGKEHVTSVMNIIGTKKEEGQQPGVEGAWGGWKHNFSSQFLSKQSPEFAKQQLDLTYKEKQDQFEEIMRLTNPSIKKKLLREFADSADSSAVHLEAIGIPGTLNHVIMPINSIKPTEIYAPNYANGTRVALVRHPHAGPFEIPQLTVNNKNEEARRLLGTGPRMDAVGINHEVAKRLSGADFDGDTVLVIPNNRRQVKSKDPLEDLRNFDPMIYKYPPDSNVPRMKNSTKQKEMGVISNLITDMSVKGASDEELARAVRHSMVVIDAEKHHLNYKESARRNNIRQLQEKYQTRVVDGKLKTGGASTLLSLAGSKQYVPERKEGYRIDKQTGQRIFTPTNASYQKNGQTIIRKQRVRKLDLVDDAHQLSSGQRIEEVYADHSNRLKSLANQARLAEVNTPNIPYSPSAKLHYANEVESLNAKLRLANLNAPKERQAQLVANAHLAQLRQANPNREKDEIKKLKSQVLIEARTRLGAGKPKIEITDAEWEAIQAGAISPSKLMQILNNANMDRVKELATPRSTVLMTPTRTARAKAMMDAHYTQAEIANALGVSVSTLKASIGGD